MQKVQPIRAFVDRIENGVAVLLIGEDEKQKLELPISCLPTGVREGNVLTITLTIEQKATQEGRVRVNKLIDELGDNP